MIRHVVLVRFRKDLPAGEIDAIFAGLNGLTAEIGGMLAFSAGRNLSPEGLDRGFTHGFTCDFRDEAARDAYLVHPSHKKLGSRIVTAAQGGLEGLAVLDFEIRDAA